jgi:hydroxymethylpyrimidine pyrophosphatase-like HAD family hydrolase
MREGIDRLDDLQEPWQREECQVNLFLFACAIACTIDDYLARHPPSLREISRRFPPLAPVLELAGRALNYLHYALTLPQRWLIRRWRRSFAATVDDVCDLLVTDPPQDSRPWSERGAAMKGRLRGWLPGRLRKERMQLPSGFRSQDLAHQDALALARLLADAHGDPRVPVVIVGPRTMGAYFAPLAAAQLRRLGWTSVSWLTLRPSVDIGLWDRAVLRAHRVASSEIVIIDESPNTGKTFLLTIRLLRHLGVATRRIHLLAALHPTRPAWRPPDDAELEGVCLHALQADRLHKNLLLELEKGGAVLLEYFQSWGWTNVRIGLSASSEEINGRLHEHFQDGFQCRLKRVFDVELSRTGAKPTFMRVLAKSVGWGWLAYHAYIAGRRLQGFVPRVLGLRNGLLFSEWLEEQEDPVGGRRVPLPRLMGTYVATRARRLPLGEDPCYEVSLRYGRTGWRVLFDTMRGVFGPYVGFVKRWTLHRRLRPFVGPVFAMIDGGMRREEWIRTPDGHRKVDYEHHNFGRTELYVVDPGYDLASAAFEFDLSDEDESELIRSYEEASDDRAVRERLPLWKLLHGVMVDQRARVALVRDGPPEVSDRSRERLVRARNFLVRNASELAASMLPDRSVAARGDKALFLDLDRVFDSDAMGFPQTTTSGLLALATLRAHGITVLLNTARGIHDVRLYCREYGLAGGVAELGSMFFDAVRGEEFPLVDDTTAKMLAAFRHAARSELGVFLDPNYRLAIRVLREHQPRGDSLEAERARQLLGRTEWDRLTLVEEADEWFVLPKGVTKGTGSVWARQHMGLERATVAAIGDGDHDIEMLKVADIAFAPANASRAVSELARAARCTVTKRRVQRGLLEAAMLLAHPDGHACGRCRVELLPAKGFGQVMAELMRVADRSAARRLLSTLDWHRL